MKGLLWFVAALIALLAFAIGYSTMRGYLSWYWLEPGARIFVNGEGVPGYVHRAGNVLLVSRQDKRPRTYQVVIGERTSVASCATPPPPKLPVFAKGDLSPMCLPNFDGRDRLPTTGLKINSGQIEFQSEDDVITVKR